MFKRRNKTIKKLNISYGDPNGICISLEDHNLSYRCPISCIYPHSSFPEGNYDPKPVDLSNAQLLELLNKINSINYKAWKSYEDIDNLCLGTRYGHFCCEYSNGSKFVFGTRTSDLPESYRDMFTLLAEYCMIPKDVLMKSGFISIPYTPRPPKMTTEVQCGNCNSFFFEESLFCPFCGKPRDVLQNTQREVEDFGDSETGIMCPDCGWGNRFIYKYCCNCGVKFHWRIPKDEVTQNDLNRIPYTPKPPKMITEVQCRSCNSYFLEESLFCPFCGKPKDVLQNTQREVEEFITSETIAMCPGCGWGNRFIYKYCCNCGVKFKWRS